jgi:hypothetical protein
MVKGEEQVRSRHLHQMEMRLNLQRRETRWMARGDKGIDVTHPMRTSMANLHAGHAAKCVNGFHILPSARGFRLRNGPTLVPSNGRSVLGLHDRGPQAFSKQPRHMVRPPGRQKLGFLPRCPTKSQRLVTWLPTRAKDSNVFSGWVALPTECHPRAATGV